MDAVSAIGAGTAAQPSDRFSELSSQEFVDIIFTELANQDPLEPNDTGALLDQLSTLRSIQSDVDLSDQLSTLVTQNELTSAASMIGKFVSGTTALGETVEDFVFSVSKTKNGPVLNLDNGRQMPVGNVAEIVDLSQFNAKPAGGSTVGATP
jgi:flagellar basal-body rod modification protein FlgD